MNLPYTYRLGLLGLRSAKIKFFKETQNLRHFTLRAASMQSTTDLKPFHSSIILIIHVLSASGTISSQAAQRDRSSSC